MNDEFFDLIDEKTGAVTGRALRRECHGNPKLLHRSIRIAVYHPDGRMLLQKRSMTKDLFPGRWDMAVGGHLSSGESWEQAAIREMGEELGLPPEQPLIPLFTMQVRNDFESENIQEFKTVTAGPFRIQQEELEEIRFFTADELDRMRREVPETMTPLLVRELEKLL